MKKTVIAIMLLLIPSLSYATGFEAAVGVWGQTPTGSVTYDGDLGEESIDLVDDADMAARANVYGRMKVETPLFLPNVYLMATPMWFKGTGDKSEDFSFGDINIDADVDFDLTTRLDHYDVALYYHLPLLGAATADILNIELGLDARFMNLYARLETEGRVASGGQSAVASQRETKAMSIALPMGYVGLQIKPADFFALEAELRGVGYDDNQYFDYIGRVKVIPFAKIKPFDMGFIAAGYRGESIKFDVDDFKANIHVGGPFVEMGVQF